MVIEEIVYSPEFAKKLKRLDAHIQRRALKSENLFKENPLHPSLRLHQLHGFLEGIWSISVTEKVCILFQREENGDIIFLSIGYHDIYKNL